MHDIGTSRFMIQLKMGCNEGGIGSSVDNVKYQVRYALNFTVHGANTSKPYR